MAAFNKFNSLAAALPNKVHNLATDQLMLAMTASANPPLVGNSQLSDLVQIAYTNCSTRVVTTTSSAQASGVYKLILADLTLTASGGDIAPFRYVVLYNNTATNKELIGYWDYGSDVIIHVGESIVVDFDNVNGVYQLTV